MSEPDAPARGPRYALDVADASYDWYRTAAIRSRRNHRISEFALLVFSAAIPLAAVIAPTKSMITAIIGSLLVVLSGLRAMFHWQENYLRFSRARETVEAERRLYHVGAPPYDDASTRDSELVKAITRIEHDEMDRWARIAERSTTVAADDDRSTRP